MHKTMRKKRNEWINEGLPRGIQHSTYKYYKQAKRIFKKELDLARSDYEQQQFQNLAHTAEVDIGAFYKIVRRKKS